jgi:hypothetical protein
MDRKLNDVTSFRTNVETEKIEVKSGNKNQIKNISKTRAQSKITKSRPTTAFSNSLNQKMKIFRLFSGKTRNIISKFEVDSMNSFKNGSTKKQQNKDISFETNDVQINKSLDIKSKETQFSSKMTQENKPIRKKRIQTSKPNIKRNYKQGLKSACLGNRKTTNQIEENKSIGEEWGDVPYELLIPEDDEYLSNESSKYNAIRNESQNDQIELEKIMEKVFNINGSKEKGRGEVENQDSEKGSIVNNNPPHKKNTVLNMKSPKSKLLKLKNRIGNQKIQKIDNLKKFKENYLANFDLNLINNSLWESLTNLDTNSEIEKLNSFKQMKLNNKLKQKISKECPLLMEFICIELEPSKHYNPKYGKKLLKTRNIRSELQNKKITEDLKEELKEAQSYLSGETNLNPTDFTVLSHKQPPITSFKANEIQNDQLSSLNSKMDHNLKSPLDSSKTMENYTQVNKPKRPLKSSKFKRPYSNHIHVLNIPSRLSNEMSKRRVTSAINSESLKSNNLSSDANMNQVSKRFLSALPERSFNIDIFSLNTYSKNQYNRSRKKMNMNKNKFPVSVSNVRIMVDSEKSKRLPSIQCSSYKGGCFGRNVLMKMNSINKENVNTENKPYPYQSFFEKNKMPFKQYNSPKKMKKKARPMTSVHVKKKKIIKNRPQTSVMKNLSHIKGCYHRVLNTTNSPLLFAKKSNQPKSILSNLFPMESPLFSSIKDLKIQSRAKGNSVTSFSKLRNLLSFAQEYEKLKKYVKAEKYYQKLLNNTEDLKDPGAKNFLANRLSFCLYNQEKLVECFAYNSLNFHQLRFRDRLLCLYNSILISRQMGNSRMEFYFLEITSKVSKLLKDKNFTFLVEVQRIVFFIIYKCFETAEYRLQVNIFG